MQNEWTLEIARLQAEANRTMKELCEARGERDKLKEKVAYLQKDNTERYARIKELEGAIRRHSSCRRGWFGDDPGQESPERLTEEGGHMTQEINEN